MPNTSTQYRIYFDTCCLSRIYDNPNQRRIRDEATAIIQIIRYVQANKLIWICSSWCISEAEDNPDELVKDLVLLLIRNYADCEIQVTQKETSRANNIESLGFHSKDSLHIACAESSQADVLLTTDDRMVNTYRRVNQSIGVRIENPITWLNRVRI